MLGILQSLFNAAGWMRRWLPATTLLSTLIWDYYAGKFLVRELDEEVSYCGYR